MGELFGFCSEAPVRWRLTRRPERPGYYREEGWGVAFLDGPAAAILRQAQGTPDPALAAVLASPPWQGQSGLAYIRRWTTSPSLANCHPFVREMGGRDWVFAHNGRLTGLAEAGMRPTVYRPIGSTDSEYAFCTLLSALAEHPDRPPGEHLDVLRALSTRLARHGALNYLLITEASLFAYSSGEYGLRVWQGEVGSQSQDLRDEDWEMHLTADTATPLVVVATNRMSADGGWRRVRAEELLFAQRGRLAPN